LEGRVKMIARTLVVAALAARLCEARPPPGCECIGKEKARLPPLAAPLGAVRRPREARGLAGLQPAASVRHTTVCPG